MICSLPDCQMTSAGTCHRCGLGHLTYHMPPAPVFQPAGCICPPTSEKTCENQMCPRKGFKVSASGPSGSALP